MGNRCTSRYSANAKEAEAVNEKTGEVSEKISRRAIHNGSILGLCNGFYNGEYISCSDDKSIKISSWKKEPFQMDMTGHSKAVNRVISNSSSSNIWSVSRDLSMKCWKRNESIVDCVHTVPDAHTLNIAAIAINVNASTIATGSRDYVVKTWYSLFTLSSSKFPTLILLPGA